MGSKVLSIAAGISLAILGTGIGAAQTGSSPGTLTNDDLAQVPEVHFQDLHRQPFREPTVQQIARINFLNARPPTLAGSCHPARRHSSLRPAADGPPAPGPLLGRSGPALLLVALHADDLHQRGHGGVLECHVPYVGIPGGQARDP